VPSGCQTSRVLSDEKSLAPDALVSALGRFVDDAQAVINLETPGGKPTLNPLSPCYYDMNPHPRFVRP